MIALSFPFSKSLIMARMTAVQSIIRNLVNFYLLKSPLYTIYLQLLIMIESRIMCRMNLLLFFWQSLHAEILRVCLNQNIGFFISNLRNIINSGFGLQFRIGCSGWSYSSWTGPLLPTRS